jgi:hypothetical protein
MNAALGRDTIDPVVGTYYICRNGHTVYMEALLAPKNLYRYVGYQCDSTGMRTGMHLVWTIKGTYYSKRVSKWDLVGIARMDLPEAPNPLIIGFKRMWSYFSNMIVGKTPYDE